MSEKKAKKNSHGRQLSDCWVVLQIRYGIEKQLDHFRTVAKLSPGGEEAETHQSHRRVTWSWRSIYSSFGVVTITSIKLWKLSVVCCKKYVLEGKHLTVYSLPTFIHFVLNSLSKHTHTHSPSQDFPSTISIQRNYKRGIKILTMDLSEINKHGPSSWLSIK